jgi:hypothetical protein
MQLTYRGQTYTTSNSRATVNTQSTFTYRGQSYQRRPLDIALIPKAKLVYRGVPYIATEESTPLNLTRSLSQLKL